jgi:hypothetical protein
LRKYGFIAFVATVIWVTSSWFIPSKGWAQDNVPIGTIPLFPPVAGSEAKKNDIDDEVLVRFDLNKIEISRNVHAEGVGGRLAVRSGLFITVSDEDPQTIQLPVQLFGETVLRSFEDPDTGVVFSQNADPDEGLIEIPIGNELALGLVSITTGQMLADGASVSAEVRSVRISVGPFDLESDSQVGGSAVIEFAGRLVPEVFLVGLFSQSTADVVSLWGEYGEKTGDLILVDVLASTMIEAGFIGQFDGIPSLEVMTSNSWRTANAENEVRVLGITKSGTPVLLGEGDYFLSSEDGMDVFSFSDVSDLSRSAIVLVKQDLAQDASLETPILSVESSTAVEIAEKDVAEADSVALPRFFMIGVVALIIIAVVFRISAVRRNRV